jgi:hypothetical protein
VGSVARLSKHSGPYEGNLNAKSMKLQPGKAVRTSLMRTAWSHQTYLGQGQHFRMEVKLFHLSGE